MKVKIIDIKNLDDSLWSSFYDYYLKVYKGKTTNVVPKSIFIERYVSTIQNDSINYEVVLNGPNVIGIVEMQFLSSGNKEKIVALDLSLSSFELFEVIENYFSSYIKDLIKKKFSIRIETREKKIIKFLKQFNFSVTNKVKYFKLQIKNLKLNTSVFDKKISESQYTVYHTDSPNKDDLILSAELSTRLLNEMKRENNQQIFKETVENLEAFVSNCKKIIKL